MIKDQVISYVMECQATGFFKKSMVATAVVLAMSGCAITPHPLTTEEQSSQIKTDRTQMFDSQEAVSRPISLSEAMARSVKYNLDHRLKLLEEAISQKQLDLSRYDLLPKLAVEAGYTGRDGYLASSSRDVRTGTQSLVPSTSQDKNHSTADLSLTWNVLDFGVSYYQAKQNADRTLVMKERRRKVIQGLMQQVRQAYWLALGAQQLDKQIEPILKEADSALGDSQKIEKEKLRSPLESLNYQRQLIETTRQLESIRDELAQAKPKLAALMNLAPGSKFDLIVPDKMELPHFNYSLTTMEEAALLNRPEIIEARYNERIGIMETRKAMAKLLPGIELNIGTHYDSNSFLVDNQWADAGVRVSWNLLNVLSGPKLMQVADAQVELAKAQRLALNMAVLSQVHVAYRDFQGRKRQFELAQKLDTLDKKILDNTRNARQANAQGKLAEIRASVSSIFSELRSYQSYGALQSAYGQLYATLGVDPLPIEVPAHDVKTLTSAIAGEEKDGWKSQLELTTKAAQ